MTEDFLWRRRSIDVSGHPYSGQPYRRQDVMKLLRRWVVTIMVVIPAVPSQAGTSVLETSPFVGARFSQITGSGGVPLNVVSKGDPKRPPVLFIHGFRQSYLSWSTQFGSGLAERCHLVAFDLRGHGNSGGPWQAEAYDNGKPWAEDVARVIDAMGLKKPLIVGWSFGGNVVMDFVRQYPEQPWSGLLLTGTVAGTQAAPSPPSGAPQPPSASPDLEVNMAALEKSMDMLFPMLPRGSSLRAKFAAAAMRVSPWVDRAIIGRARSAEVIPLQGVTFVNGGKDPIVRPAFVEKLKDFFPNAQFVDFPESGHAPFLEDPDRFNALIDKLQCGPR